MTLAPCFLVFELGSYTPHILLQSDGRGPLHGLFMVPVSGSRSSDGSHLIYFELPEHTCHYPKSIDYGDPVERAYTLIETGADVNSTLKDGNHTLQQVESIKFDCYQDSRLKLYHSHPYVRAPQE